MLYYRSKFVVMPGPTILRDGTKVNPPTRSQTISGQRITIGGLADHGLGAGEVEASVIADFPNVDRTELKQFIRSSFEYFFLMEINPSYKVRSNDYSRVGNSLIWDRPGGDM